MSQIHPEIKPDDYHRPSGLFSRALQTFNKATLLLLLVSFIVTFFDVDHLIKVKNGPDFLTNLLVWWAKINNIFGFVTIIYLIFKRKSYIKFITYFEEQIGVYTENSHIRKFIGNNRTITKMFYPLFVMILITNGIVEIYFRFLTSYQLTFVALFTILRTLIYLHRFLIIQFIIESCLHVQICFKMVLDEMESLKKADGFLMIEQLQKIRQLYDIAAKKTRKLDSSFFLILSIHYLETLGALESHLAGLIYNFKPIHLMMLVYHVLILIFVTFHVANINRLANAAFNRVYSLSYKTHSLELINEIRYFLTRIGRNDVGLTLLKIVTITPGFVTSIATISLTLSLAIPSLFNKAQ